ncbi:MAG: hypothetical protein GTN73_08870 [Candidatus Aminicenantes bacterium]|nr:hypothetical protein [Candidatus Aminicenantes bacterium]
MRKKVLFFSIMLAFCVHAMAETSSLSQIFLLGKGIKDLDKDNLGEKVSVHIIVPDTPTACELAVAGDIAARANLESLVIDFSLVKKESEVKSIQSLENPILIGTNLKWIKKLKKERKINLPQLEQDQGLVSLLYYKNKPLLVLTAGSEEALLRAGRSFFLRWPYLWEIWGQEEGVTYFSLEKDLTRFLGKLGTSTEKITIKEASYEFPQTKSPHQSLRRLKFNSGEIRNLVVEIGFPDKKQKDKAFEALESLRLQHKKGLSPDILSYPGCAQMTFELHSKNEISKIILHRMGYPKRILTPSYKVPLKPRTAGKNFDLLSLFSTKGFYSDSDKDSILDKLDTSLIIPQDSGLLGSAQLASRLVLSTAGASFPILFLDKEIEEQKALVSPVLIGRENILNKELIKKGKLKIPPLQKNWGMAKVVSEAFNKSNALAIVGADRFGLEKTLTFLSKTFPYLDDYKEGSPQIRDVPSDLEGFFKGEKGSAEAYFDQKMKKLSEDIKGKVFESIKAELFLPQKNLKFEEYTRKFFEDSAQAENLEIKSFELRESKTIFEKEKEFLWEGDEALKLIQEKIKTFESSALPLKINLGLSESPKVREKIKTQIEALLRQNNIAGFEVKVLSAYKQGFFWLLEEILPYLSGENVSRLTIRFAEEKENLSKPKRFYAEPYRWLQELYPVDEILSKEAKLPLKRIEFELKKEEEPVYEFLAFDEKNRVLLKKSFSPRIRETIFLKVLPEWGKVKLTTGWLKIERGRETLLDKSIKCDLERFWEYYQDEILPDVYSHVMKKTGNEPKFSKQPYFKRILMEMWFSEPDYKLGLDEEIVSSLEAIHDEIYFDTLDFLRGITEVEIEEKDSPEDISRYSAPGNVLPLIHPSLEGGKGRAKVILEDWQAQSPQLILRLKEKGKEEYSKKIIFPSIKPKTLLVPSFVYNGKKERIENLIVEVKVEKEAEYLVLIDLIDSYRRLLSEGIIQSFSYPRLERITIKIRYKELEKEEPLLVSFKKAAEREIVPSAQLKDKLIVPTDKIISPQMCLDIVHRLSHFNSILSYFAGKSYENRKIPVLEIFTPLERYTSLPRLITFKPTLYLSARQHANEVSSTNYALKYAELLAKNKTHQDYVKKMNFVIHPMENPDGAELAYELQKLTPFHSLHAGRYSALGIDVGYQVNAPKPLLPEAKVRRNIYNRWLPDIYLNLHGYPSHEWVQQFSNYSPYLFRDYWIPRGWFSYYRSLSLPIYQKWKEAGEELRKFITEEINANEKISSSNNRFYNRYYRWASRWQPHMNYLELYDGFNLYSKRRSSRESKLSARRKVTFVEETPELMDETAHGNWLDFLCEQGLTYLRAHSKYLSRVKFETARLEEESQDRIHIWFIRSRPGKVRNADKK